MIKKVISTLVKDSRSRGGYYALLMNISHAWGILRALFYKLIYLRNIQSTIFSLQSNSRLEVYNKEAKIKIGKFVYVRKNASLRVDLKGELSIGDKVFLNDNCNINCVNKITIGEKTKIASGVSINDHDHNFKTEGNHLLVGEVHIGKNVWIGSNVVILKDTFIGDHSVIAAGSVVKGHVPENTVFINKRENEYKNILKPTGMRDAL
ncbi:acyltransferase [Halobacillus litoralis]|nr:acyltransferase [Halobacillus litoralis]